MKQDTSTASAPNALSQTRGDDRAWQLRVAAARGEKTPISLRGWLRLITRAFLMAILITIFVPLHYLYRVFAYGSPFPMWFLRFTARIAGAKVHVHGTHLKRDVFYMSNHVSWLDILSLAGACGTAFVAKAELEKAPLVGWLSKINRTVFVKREARMSVADQINALKEALADNWSVTVFPEGTTTDGQSLLPFKTSMLSVLEPPPPGVMVQPVMIDYGEVAEWVGWIGEEDGLNNAKRILSRKGTFPVHIHFLEPFSPAEYVGRKAIGIEGRRRIEEALCEALGKPLRDFAHDVPPIRYSASEATIPHDVEAL